MTAPEAARPPGRAFGDRLADVAGALTVLAVLAAHLNFILRDQRLPRDLGQYYLRLPRVYAALEAPWENLAALWGMLLDPGGWYQLSLACWLRLVGRSPFTFQMLDLLLVGAAIVLTGWLARTLAGPRASLVAVSLMGSFTMIVVQGRTGWIHIPELVLVLVALVAWTRDRALRSWATVVVMGLAGAFAIALRPSAMIWMASLLPLMVLGVRGQGRAGWLRLLLVLGCWGLGLAVQLGDLAVYLGAKLNARERYAAKVPGLDNQLRIGLGRAALVAGVPGLVASLFRRPQAVVALLLAWLSVPLLLILGFQVGLDNFPVFCVALAVLAGVGYARHLRPLTWFVLLAFLGAHLPQWSPELPEGSPLADWLARHTIKTQGFQLNYQRPFLGFGKKELLALVDATCPEPPERCTVLVDQGLFVPYSEDPGHLELFLAGLDHVTLWETRMEGDALNDLAPDVLVQYDCGQHDFAWRERYPHTLDRLFQILEHTTLEPAWSTQWTLDQTFPTCCLVWMTPERHIIEPDLLPPQGEPCPRSEDGRPLAPMPPGAAPLLPPSASPAERRRPDPQRIKPGMGR